ncbi:hypothetical protein WMY93_017838 [Mugilogobius chulae]|uniref:Uncharacterized protein n=1 Tax=Mugilogobius chulae TaxID=88201 RepID=A0AAW0P0T9_9GOBI
MMAVVCHMVHGEVSGSLSCTIQEVLGFCQGLLAKSEPTPQKLCRPLGTAGLLEGLSGPPFEPLDRAELSCLSFKTFLVIASAKRARELCVHSIHPSCMFFSGDGGLVELWPNQAFQPRMSRVIRLGQRCHPPHASAEGEGCHLSCPVRAFRRFLHCTAGFRYSDQLFVGFDAKDRGTALSSQRLAHWVCQAGHMTDEAEGRSPPALIRARFTWCVATFSATLRGVPLEEICLANSWSSLSTFVQSYLLDVTVWRFLERRPAHCFQFQRLLLEALPGCSWRSWERRPVHLRSYSFWILLWWCPGALGRGDQFINALALLLDAFLVVTWRSWRGGLSSPLFLFMRVVVAGPGRTMCLLSIWFQPRPLPLCTWYEVGCIAVSPFRTSVNLLNKHVCRVLDHGIQQCPSNRHLVHATMADTAPPAKASSAASDNTPPRKAPSSRASSTRASGNKASSYKTRSETGSTSSAAAKARAKAEAAKARLSFAQEEMSLKIEKAKLEASIQLLQQQKDVASAIAEAEALETAAASQLDAQSDPTPSETNERTKQCCASSKHIAKDCKVKLQCSECGNEKHCAALHPGPATWHNEPRPSTEPTAEPPAEHGGEPGSPDKAVQLYAIHDEQSNRSLVRPEFFELFNDCGPSSPYSLRTCAGVKETMGRRATGYTVEALDGTVQIPLPSLIECKNIPNDRDEIPTPSAALHHSHLKSVANLIPELDSNAQILMLLGRDVVRVHKVRKQISGPHNAPYAQKLDLGWVIVGNVCLGDVHKTLAVKTLFTNATEKGRPTMFEPCPNVYTVKERHCDIQVPYSVSTQLGDSTCEPDHLGCNVFKQTRLDNYIAPSIQDKAFLKTMEEGLTKDKDGNWTAPLPFKSERQKLPNNRPQALNRLMSLVRNFERKDELKEHFINFMDKVFKNGHAEIAPPLEDGEECWYLPLFGVYHPRKPKQIRVVFDSSAKYDDVSLNDVLLTGPDLNNSLLGVLMRFRKEAVAFTADIEQMFYCFNVREQDRNYLRFLWFRDNDLSKDITEYRMTVHVFGNSPSPAVAIYGLHQSVLRCECDPDVEQFVTRDFYVDDGLKSLPTVEKAVSLLQRTRDTLSKSNLRLHKIATNRKEVLEAFPSEDHAKDLKELDFEADSVPIQRSLGLLWDIKKDCFTFKTSDETKPFTRRGVLSTINSLYDPLGFVAPVTIQGKSILRELTVENGDWDAPLPPEMEETWTTWKDSLKELSKLSIPRVYTDISPSTAAKKELCVYSDASTKAIAAVAYLRVVDTEGNCQVGFVMGKAKLAPRPDQTIPRLELSAAVLAVELADLISDELDIELDNTMFYTDSKVVLGYIYNETRRFYVYVSNRVNRIRRSSQPSQWHYIASSQNPADHATRSVPAYQLPLSNWLTGPDILFQNQNFSTDTYDLVEPSTDAEVRPQVSTLKTTTCSNQLGSQRFTKFSSWISLTRAFARLLHIIHNFKSSSPKNKQCKGWHYCETGLTVAEINQAQNIVIRAVQQDVYADEIKCIQKQEKLPKAGSLKNLDPFLDENGILRVGGRIAGSNLNQNEKNPVIVPGHHHLAALLIRHYHEQTHHQGRLFTEGAVRAAGWWIVGGKRKVASPFHLFERQ